MRETTFPGDSDISSVAVSRTILGVSGCLTMARRDQPYPVTLDGRYFVVRGRLWRTTNPDLSDEVRQALVSDLMAAQRAARAALHRGDADLAEARAVVNTAKIALGERGPVWWGDGAPDLNRHMARNTPYADWFAGLDGQ